MSDETKASRLAPWALAVGSLCVWGLVWHALAHDAGTGLWDIYGRAVAAVFATLMVMLLIAFGARDGN